MFGKKKKIKAETEYTYELKKIDDSIEAMKQEQQKQVNYMNNYTQSVLPPLTTTGGTAQGSFGCVSSGMIPPMKQNPNWNIQFKELYDFQLRPTNHLENYKVREGFKWLDKNEEWAMLPTPSDPMTATEIQLLMPQQFVLPNGTGSVTTTGPVKKDKIMFLHRHDDDHMMKLRTLNSRYHGPAALICEECDKPCPDEYRMMYALQNSLSDKG